MGSGTRRLGGEREERSAREGNFGCAVNYDVYVYWVGNPKEGEQAFETGLESGGGKSYITVAGVLHYIDIPIHIPIPTVMHECPC